MEREPADLSRLSLDDLIGEHLRIQAWRRSRRDSGPMESWLAGYQRNLKAEIERRLAARRRDHEEAETKGPG